MVLGFIVFSMASMDQNAHSVDSNRPGGSDRSAGKTVAPAKPAFEKMFGHASFGGLPAAQNAPSSTASSNDPPQKQPLMAPLPPGMEFEKPPGKRSRARRKEDQRQ
ncbi:hypothetical protein, partial [Candidatus Glomeribacter gigasporarum]|uniref:hypothetical protein n=1 Tax=Candidatus Glomeribacter gigasporarum TaxID=132144 RepID=UPI003B967BC1